MTYLFYRIDKCQTVKFRLVRVERRVDDPAAPTGIELNQPAPPRNVAIIPDAILGTHTSRLQVAQQVNQAIPAEERTPDAGQPGVAAVRTLVAQAPVPAAVRAAALAQVEADLAEAGLIDKKGAVTQQAQQNLGWEHTLRLPTPGVIVKGCLDDCCTCEPNLEKEIELELARKELENELLKRRIALLDKAQEYRCCQAGDSSADTPADAPATPAGP